MSPTVSAGKRKGPPGALLAIVPAAIAVALLLPASGCRREKAESGSEAIAGVEESANRRREVKAAPAPTKAALTGEAKKAAGDQQGKNQQSKNQQSKKKPKGGAPVVPPPAVAVVVPAERLTTEQIRAEVAALQQESANLGASVTGLTPSEPYILINTTLNRMSMKAGDRVILQDGIVSTGSNTQLVEQDGERRWFFSTPKGVHVVRRKMVAPIWVKPDWAFIEEGEPVPGAQAEARFEEGTLGKYALYFGNGYMIHGTLFQRFLGQSVTHGCVRVGDADLETVYQNAKVGTKIYIY